MKRDNSYLGEKIKRIRKDKGLTMEEFGKIFNTSKGAVNNWEKGRNLPNKANLKSVADLAGITVDELLDDTCRWKKVDEWTGLSYKIYSYRTDCKQHFEIRNLKNKYSYCPNCGKQIKFEEE